MDASYNLHYGLLMLIPINAGDQFVTLSKSITSPFPKLSKRITKREKAKLNDWLQTNAILEAVRQGNDFAKGMFECLDVRNWSTADGESVHQFLFGAKYVNGHIGDLKYMGSVVSELQLNANSNTTELDPLIAWAFT